MTWNFRRIASVAGIAGLCLGLLATTANAATRTTTAVPAKLCPELETDVAVFKEGRKGAEVTVYTAASSTSAPLAKIKTGVQVFGRVVFRVLGTEGEFYKVMPPARPNSSIGFVRRDQVVTYTTPFRIDISLAAKTLKVYECGTEIVSAKIGVGKPKTPTPTGSFFLVDLIKPKQGGGGPYGPFAFGLSGYSKVFQTFGAGDGRVGIHGTNQPKLLGTAVSSGCIRIDNATITKMASTLYLGSPVNIS